MSKSTLESFFGTDEKKSKTGVRIPMGYNVNDEEVAFWIAEVNNPKHTAAQRANSRLMESSRKNTKRYDAVLAKVVAQGILLKWEGVLDEDKKEVKDTIENRTKYLIKYPKLFQAVMEQSMNQDNYAPEDEETEQNAQEDTEKN
jgi:hypothetical protein